MVALGIALGLPNVRNSATTRRPPGTGFLTTWPVLARRTGRRRGRGKAPETSPRAVNGAANGSDPGGSAGGRDGNVENHPPAGYNERAPDGCQPSGARWIIPVRRGRLAAKLTGRGSPKEARIRGEGVLLRAGYCSRPATERKSGTSASPETHQQPAGPLARSTRLSAEEKARRVDALRVALADAAPEFRARDRYREGGSR